MIHESIETQGERALVELAPKLGSLDELGIARPSTDPHAAAVTALLVADYLSQPDVRVKLGGTGMTEEATQELASLSRAILAVVARLGGDYLPDAKSIPGDLVQRGQAVRETISVGLQKGLPDDPDIRVWLEAVRLGSGVVDLVYDLRTLAELCARHAAAGATATTTEVFAARAAADAIEFALRTADSPEQVKARNTLSRLWTFFVPAYEKASEAGRKLTRESGNERQFPPLAVVASHRRARRRPLSLVPTAHRSAPPRASAAPSAASIPAVAALPEIGEVTLREAAEAADAGDADAVVERSPSAPLLDVEPERVSDILGDIPGDRASSPESRRANRQMVEIEVGFASQSNFYLGFTENLSSGGVFVATYALQRIGSKIEVALSFPTGEQLKVAGVVRWLREASADGWPGMGVQFETLTDEDEAKIRKFLSLREPLFYDD